MHSQEIIHGNLCGDNVVLDSDFHCQIAGFGSTQHSGVSVENFSPSLSIPPLFQCTTTFPLNYSAPELIGIRGKTPTDVYAFGCLYYAMFFGTMPYQEENDSQIAKLVTSGVQPGRLSSPPMDDGIWDLIQRCWRYIPSERPTMEQIMLTHMTFAPLPSLVATLSELAALGDPMVNENTLHLMHKLLNLSESDLIFSELGIVSDVELLLDFVLILLRNSKFADAGANRKARRLMFKLMSTTNVIPRSLFITNVTVRTDSYGIGMGGFGHVYKGEHGRKPVAVKVLYKVRHKQDSIRQDFCREALVWRSLLHRFILPLLGIYEEESGLFLVLPFMSNGTLTDWRKNEQPSVVEINRVLLEVAQGFQYIHSEGIVHGDLHGGNILLDSELHCQISDFGLTRHAEATVARSTRRFVPNYAAPELFGMCIKCGLECDGCEEGHITKTMETDVYAFGCLHYATFFDTAPFHGKNDFQIVGLVRSGVRPGRLESPKMEDDTWDLIENCWKSNPVERLTMEQIVEALT
ncbi:kinase-like domain-containing protein [Amanita rubescens]|nr:kinase-like domain-containing protein [Amanita rubescens]